MIDLFHNWPVALLTYCPYVRAEDAGLKQEAVKILPWETRVEEKSIFCHVSFMV